MKKHISLLLLYARSTMFAILVLLAVMSVVEIGLFGRQLTEAIAAAGPTASAKDGMDSLEEMVRHSHMPLVFGTAYLAMTLLLCRTGCGYGSRPAYTMNRLSVSAQAAYWWQAGYNAACYLVLWGAQLVSALICCLAYTTEAPAGAISAQTVFLAFYRSPFLHALLPLEDVLLWIRNLLFIAGLALATARFPVCQRQGKFSASVIPMTVTGFLFCQALGEGYGTLAIFPSLAVIGGVLWAVLQRGEDDEAA